VVLRILRPHTIAFVIIAFINICNSTFQEDSLHHNMAFIFYLYLYKFVHTDDLAADST